MRKSRLLALVAVTVLGLGGSSLAEPLYTWEQVVERGMPDFNDPLLLQEASATDPLHLSFPSGVRVSFLAVVHEKFFAGGGKELAAGSCSRLCGVPACKSAHVRGPAAPHVHSLRSGMNVPERTGVS
jgi:hypothetical protein